MMEALSFARKVDTPLNAHLTIHWGGTHAGDDPRGKLSAKLRECLDKWLHRQGVSGGLTAIWVRERHRNRRTGGLSHCTHFHMLFHLPSRYQLSGLWRGALLHEIERLVDRHGRGNLDDRTIELTFPKNPDGKYLLKGGSRAVWDAYRVPDKWRSKRGEGVIEGKRSGTTQNIGPAERRRWQEQVMGSNLHQAIQ